VQIDAAVDVYAALYDPQEAARSTEHEPQADMVKIPGRWWGKATMTAEQAVVSSDEDKADMPKDAHNLEKEKLNLAGDKTGSERPGLDKVALDRAGAEKAGIGTPVLAHDKRRGVGTRVGVAASRAASDGRDGGYSADGARYCSGSCFRDFAFGRCCDRRCGRSGPGCDRGAAWAGGPESAGYA